MSPYVLKKFAFFEWSRLTKLVFGHIISHPSDFFWPRDKPMKYARIDSQGHMIFDDTSAQKNGKSIPSNYVVRRLSDVRILPESKHADAQHSQTNTDINYEKQPTDEHTQPYNSPEKVMDLDDGLVDDELNSVPYTDDIQYDKATKTISTIDNDVVSDEPHHTDSDDKQTGDAKTPLPKPKKPPKLPS
nr:hypothetical protein [Psychrobacter sp. JCM 18900]